MSLHFNWSRLDETCAEALRQLINKRLAEVVERINNKNAGGGNAAAAAAADASHHSSPPSTASQAFSGSGNAGKFNGGATTLPSLVGVTGGMGGNGAVNSTNNNNNLSTAMMNPMRADPSSNVSAHGSPREVYGGVFGAADLSARSPFLSSSPATNLTGNSLPGPGAIAGGGVSANVSTVGGGLTTALPSQASTQHYVGGSGSTTHNNNTSTGALATLRVDTNNLSGVSGPPNDDGGVYGARLGGSGAGGATAGYGAVAVRGGGGAPFSSNNNNNNNNHSSAMGSGLPSPVPTSANDFYSVGGNNTPARGFSNGQAASTATGATAAGAAAPSSPSLLLRENERNTANNHNNSGSNGVVKGGVAAPHKVPPIVYLEVGSVEWGTTPPFVEIVAFDNATDGPPGYNRVSSQQQQQQPPQRGFSAASSITTAPNSGPFGDASPYALSHVASTDTGMASSTAHLSGGCYPATTAATAAGAGATTAATAVSTAANAPIGGDGGADNNSESSHDFTVSHSATGVNTPHIVSNANAAGYASGAAQQTQASASLSQFPSQPETTDALASVLGYGGLHIRFHITYGGALHLSLNTAVQHEIRLGAVALRVSLPMMFYLANLDLDCYLCINVRNNVCQVWLEHGPLSSSVVNRLSITATFGGDEEEDDDDVDYGASSTDFYSRFGSSSVSDDDNGEGGNGAYVNEHEVSQFVLHELRAILKETIVAPHCITIPISFDG